MELGSTELALASAALVGAIASVHLLRRRRRQRRDAAALAEKVEKRLYVPRSLHPVIDPDLCMGSLSCLKACPEGDILGIVEGAARLVHADHCIGHGRCAAECPVGAIKLVMGTAERGVDLPEVDQFFESSRPGVHVIGELGGMGLIRNAIAQGLQVAKHLDQVLPRAAPGKAAAGAQPVDVAVVGAGPAGLAAAMGLRQAGRTVRVLEQDTLGGSIAHYPRRKVVMTEPAVIPYHGKLGKTVIAKEELLAVWEGAVASSGLQIESGVRVEGIAGEEGRLEVQTSAGPVLARKVVLATGRRGTPRRLGVPGEDLPKVTYGFSEPEHYDGRRVLVVGGGDSALEAAIRIAERGQAEVALSYRGAELSRAREANRSRAMELAGSGELQLLLPSEVRVVEPGEVHLDWGGRAVRIPNDDVLVHIGGEVPTEFLRKVGVEMRRYHGERLGVREGQGEGELEEERVERRRLRRTALLYALLGAAVVALLAWKGWGYYRLGTLQRLRSPLHKALRPAGSWGHGVGIAATAFMLSNFLYAVRKRSRRLTGVWNIKDWLNFHVFVGFMSPLVIVFHAAFRFNNALATSTAAALWVVVATGIVGRFIYGLVPGTGGKEEEMAMVAARFERIRSQVEPMLAGARDRRPLEALMALATAEGPRRSLVGALVRLPAASLALRWRLRRVRRLLPEGKSYPRFRAAVLRLRRLRFQIAFYGGLRRLLRGWRVVHASLAGFLVFAIAVHIAVSLYLGYGLR